VSLRVMQERQRRTKLPHGLSATRSGGEGTRTLDLRLAKPPLFQLSYTPGTTFDP
jgi:hypothetical protein